MGVLVEFWPLSKRGPRPQLNHALASPMALLGLKFLHLCSNFVPLIGLISNLSTSREVTDAGPSIPLLHPPSGISLVLWFASPWPLV
jgi:hypothetical protein